MASSLKYLALLLGSGLSLAGTREDLRTLRFLSETLRDRPPTREEAEAVYRGEKSLEQLRDAWLASPEHKERVARYFSDLLGAPRYFFVNDEAYFLEQNSDGTWYSPAKGDCTAAQTSSATAWWEDAGTSIKICSNIVSSQMSVTVSGTYYGCSWTDGFLRAGCGCGPEQILCYPKAVRSQLQLDLAREFQERASYVYSQQLSWHDLLASAAIYGNRPMAQFYLINQYVSPWQSPAPMSEINRLRQIPMREKIWFDAPQVGAARAGIVTAPAFMRRFNNGRSRIRALSDALLCHDVDGSLNTSGISRLVNPDVNALGQSIVTRPQCAVCHYGMDNMASTLFGWNDQGAYERWPKQLAQSGHAFGVDIEGPQALMESFIERGPGFAACMSKRAWEDLSGRPWSALSVDEQNAFIEAAGSSPASLLGTIFRSPALMQARGAGSAASIEGSSWDFTADIDPILQRSCSGSSCHSSDSSLAPPYHFIGDAAAFKNASVRRLQDGTMPPESSGKVLPDSERNRLIQYLLQP